MPISLLIFVASLYLLYKGSDWLVKYSSNLAKHFGVTKLVIGLTIVALGTSTPEIATVLVAAGQGNDSLALGNVVGSNIANIALVLGLATLIRPVTVKSKTLRSEIPFMAGSALLLWWFAFDGIISTTEGLVFILCSVIFFLYMLYIARDEKVFDETLAQFKGKLFNRTSGKQILLLSISLVVLMVGAKLLVDSAVDIATTLGIDPFVIAVTVVAIGTSLPELASSIVAAIKKQNDIILGDIIGSNVVNILIGLGLAAVFFPIVVQETVRHIDIPFMFGLTLLVWLMLRTKYRLTRFEGVALLLIYGVYIYALVM